ncbi:sigma-70 family RNA polymerase sigma factor [Patescibacteria group bacterium]|nr:sigma-70 family RNA polymerase sigma factor [Patescibacteria group bacterium]
MANLELEQRLVEKAKRNPQDFNQLYELYFEKIYNFLLARCGQKELAEDITSQTFLNALEKIHNFKWRNVSFGAWLYRIAINNLNSHFRKNNRIILTEDENLNLLISQQTSADSAESDLEQRGRITELYQTIKKLSADEQNLIILKYFQHKSYQEIAKILKLSSNTVGVKLHRSLRKLKIVYHQKIK